MIYIESYFNKIHNVYIDGVNIACIDSEILNIVNLSSKLTISFINILMIVDSGKTILPKYSK